MVNKESRRLEIVTAVKDFASSSFRRIGKTITATFKGGIATISAFRTAISKTSSLLQVAFAGVIAQRVVSTFGEMAEGLDQVNQQARATNTSASSMLLLRNAAQESGIGFDQLSAAIRTFEKNIGDARQGAVTQSETLRRLGLNTDQFVGTQKDAVEQLAIVADGLSNVEDASIRMNLALKLFGEDTGAALLPILSQGGDALRSFAKRVRESGEALTDDQIRRASEYQVALQKLRTAFRQLAEQTLINAAPALVKFFTTIRELLQQNGPFIRKVLNEIIQAFGTAFGLLIRLGGLLRRSLLGLQQIATATSLALSTLRGDTEGIEVAKDRLRELVREVDENDKFAKKLADAFFDLDVQLEKFGKREFPKFEATTTPPGDPSSPESMSQRFGSFFDGFRENTLRARDRWTNFRQAGLDAANTLVDQGLNNLSNAFGDWIAGVRKGREVWREFGRQVLADLARIIGRLITINLVSSLFNGDNTAQAETGAVFEGNVRTTVPLRRFERGGVVRRPTLALFGEGRAQRGEAFVPLPDGRRIPVALGGAGAGMTNITYNIQAMDGRDVARLLFEQRGTLRTLHQRDLRANQGVRQNVRSVVS